jgi:radical SAM protein with 4Fe4S-binding SPASM domain
MKVVGEKHRYVQELLSSPEYLMIEPTNRCNLDCITCTRASLDQIGDLSYDNLQKILDKFPDVKTIKFHGLGEPMLTPGIVKMLELIKDRGIDTVIVSNLQWNHIDIEYVLSLMKHLYISYHALDKNMYYTITGNKGNWELLHKNIQLIKEKNKNHTDVMLNYVCTNENVRDIEKMVQRAYDLGILYVRFQIVQNWADYDNEKYHNRLEKLKIKNMEEAMDYFVKAVKLAKQIGVNIEIVGNEKFDYKQCIWPFRRAYITFTGEVVPCCMRPTPKFSMGNIFETDFNEIWNSEKYHILRSQLSNNEESEMCKGCPYFDVAPTISKIKNRIAAELLL